MARGEITWRRLVPGRWTHGDNLDRGAFRPSAVVVHLIRDIVDHAARSERNGVVAIEFGAGADQEGSRQNRDESLVRMGVRLAPIVGAAFEELD